MWIDNIRADVLLDAPTVPWETDLTSGTLTTRQRRFLVVTSKTMTWTDPESLDDVEVEYVYEPPEDWGGYGYRVPGQATILSPPELVDDERVLEKIYENHS